jgi:hypothetical protein
MMGC